MTDTDRPHPVCRFDVRLLGRQLAQGPNVMEDEAVAILLQGSPAGSSGLRAVAVRYWNRAAEEGP